VAVEENEHDLLVAVNQTAWSIASSFVESSWKFITLFSAASTGSDESPRSSRSSGSGGGRSPAGGSPQSSDDSGSRNRNNASNVRGSSSSWLTNNRFSSAVKIKRSTLYARYILILSYFFLIYSYTCLLHILLL
jgi:hypothetical protein